MPRVETPETDGEAQSECDVVADDDDGGGRSVNLQFRRGIREGEEEVEEEQMGTREERRWGRRARPSRVNDESSSLQLKMESSCDTRRLMSTWQEAFSSTGHVLGACLTQCKDITIVL